MEGLFWFSLILQIAFSIGQQLGFRECGKAFLTVSSLDQNFVEMNWVTNCYNPNDLRPDFIKLYNYDVKEKGYDNPLLSINSNYFNGYHQTEIKFGSLELPQKWTYSEKRSSLGTGKYCHRFWIASFCNGRVLDVDCFSLNPSWMSDISDKILKKSIGEIMIPGTHNSGSFLSKGKLFQTYVMNQEVDIWQQLVYGIRYFDFRVGYYGMEKFTLNHDILPLGNVRPLLVQLQKFLELSPKEIVILDFHRFPVPPLPNNDAHHKFVKLIHDVLGKYILSPNNKFRGKGPTMQEIWSLNRNLIVCYGEKHIAQEYPWLWDPLKQYWGDSGTPKELHTYLGGVVVNHPTGANPLWAAMAELTPRAINVIFKKSTLRKLADNVNRHVTSWFRERWYNSANIVATDYFFGNDIINVAIGRNAET